MYLGPRGLAFLPLQGPQWPDVLRRCDSGHLGMSLAPIMSARVSAAQCQHITAQGETVKGDGEMPGGPPRRGRDGETPGGPPGRGQEGSGSGVRVWEEEERRGRTGLCQRMQRVQPVRPEHPVSCGGGDRA